MQPRRWDYLAIFSLALSGMILFGQSLFYPFFIFDDATHIQLNTRFHPVSLESIAWIWTHSLMSVTYTFWAVIAGIWGTANPTPFRVANLALHIANSYLVFLWTTSILNILARKEGHTRIFLAALFSGFVFLVHPVHVENIAWISSTKDLLSIFFVMLSFQFYFRSRQREGAAGFGESALFMICLALGILSKASAAVLILIFLWLDRALFSRPFRKSLIEYLIGATAGVVAALLYFRATPPHQLEFIPDFSWSILISLDALSHAFIKLFVPFNYYFDYGRTPLEVMRSFVLNPALQVPITVSGILVLSGIILSYFRHRLRALHIALGFIAIALLPYSGLIPFAFQNISTVADRYLYLPSVGFSLLAALGILRVGAKKMPALALITLGVLSISTFQQTRIWKTSVIVLSNAVDKNPMSYTTRMAFSEALHSEGLVDEATEQRKFAEIIQAERSQGY